MSSELSWWYRPRCDRLIITGVGITLILDRGQRQDACVAALQLPAATATSESSFKLSDVHPTRNYSFLAFSILFYEAE